MTCRLFPMFIVLAAFLGGGATHAAAPDWHAKVDSSVLRDADKGQTEFLVYFETQADLSGAAALKTKEEKGSFVYQQLRAAAAATQAPILAELESRKIEHRSYWISNLIWVKGDLAAVESMASKSAVQRVYPSGYGVVHAPVDVTPETGKPNAGRAVENNLTHINADDAWALGFRGQGVVVAGADTGVLWDHETLKNSYRGWDGVSADHD